MADRFLPEETDVSLTVVRPGVNVFVTLAENEAGMDVDAFVEMPVAGMVGRDDDVLKSSPGIEVTIGFN